MINRKKLFTVLRSIVADFASVEKKFIEQGEIAEDVKKYIKFFKELRDGQKIRDVEDRNIDNWGKKPFSELVGFVDGLKEVPAEIRQLKQKKISGANLIAENKEWFVYEISSYDASKHLADGAGWCIKHDNHWNNYTLGTSGDGPNDFYFLISKTRSDEKEMWSSVPIYKDKWKKIALQFSEKGKITYWDAWDESHSKLPPDVASTVPEFTPEFSGRIKVEDGKFYRMSEHIPKGSTIKLLNEKSLNKIKEIPDDVVVDILDLRNSSIEKMPVINCNKLYLGNSKIKEIPSGTRVASLLDLSESPDIKLPDNLRVDKIILTNSNVSKLPNNLGVTYLDLTGSKIEEIPENLDVSDLILNNRIKKIPESLKGVDFLDASLSGDVEFPENFKVGSIRGLSKDTKISKLPKGLDIFDGDLDLSDTQITELPDNLKVNGELKIPKNLKKLPEWLKVGTLNLSGSQITEIPWNTEVIRLNINNTKIKDLPSPQEYVDLLLKNTPVEKFDVESVLGTLDIRGTQIESISSLREVGKLYLNDKVTSLPKDFIVNRIYVKENQLKDIPEKISEKIVEIY